MRPTQTFIDLVRSIGAGGAGETLGRLRDLAAAEGPAGPRLPAMRRHLEALAFRFEGEDRPGDLADAAALIAGLPGADGARWAAIEAGARLRDLCEGGRFAQAGAFAARLRAGADGGEAIRAGVATLMRLGWVFECAREPEPCLQCYRLAHDLGGGDLGGGDLGGDERVTEDGDPLPVKIKNLRRLLLDDLVGAGRFEAAIALHDASRHVDGAGRLAAYAISTARALAERGGATYAELGPARRIVAPELRFVKPPPPLTSEPGDLDVPAQYLAFVRDCVAFPRSNVVVAGDTLVYDLAAHRRRPDILLQDGLNPDQIMTAAFAGARALVEVPEDPLPVEAGLSMFGLQSRNYGHWFCEFVPRMLCYNDPRCPDGLPLCIDDHMPGSHEEILRLLDTRDRPVIKLPPRPVAFGLLGMAPVPAFFPFEMKPGRPVYDAIWPADVFAAIRARILERARERGVLTGRTDRRLFISRKAFTQRALVNEEAIAERLRPLGFEVIYPETLSFLEQVDAFHTAAVVVGSSSSALSNALFCRPGCRILGLIHEELAFNFRGYTSYIEAGGARITFLRGRTLHRPGIHAFHVSYTVEPDAVVAALRALERGDDGIVLPPSPAGMAAAGADLDGPAPPAGADGAVARVDPARLARLGSLAAGSGGAGGLCALEAVAFLAHEPPGDRPACTCPSLAAFVSTWNDGLPQPARDRLILPLVPRLVGTRGSPALARRRAAMAVDWLVRAHLPAWFRLAKLNVEADAFAGLPELADPGDLAGLCDDLKRARKRAAVGPVTLRQTGAAVRAAAWDATHQAAWDCARDALEAAGPAAATWDAATWDAAAWDAAFAAAYAAARAYGKASLEPTRGDLERSALALVERMIAAREPEPEFDPEASLAADGPPPGPPP